MESAALFPIESIESVSTPDNATTSAPTYDPYWQQLERQSQQPEFLQGLTSEIGAQATALDEEFTVLGRKTAQTMYRMGQICLTMKEILPHGNYGKWLESKGLDYSMASAWGNVCEHFQSSQITNFVSSALRTLGAPSVPAAARQEAIERASKGETIDLNKAKEIRDRHKSPDGHTFEEVQKLYEPLGLFKRNGDLKRPYAFEGVGIHQRFKGLDEAVKSFDWMKGRVEDAIKAHGIPSDGNYGKITPEFIQQKKEETIEPIDRQLQSLGFSRVEIPDLSPDGEFHQHTGGWQVITESPSGKLAAVSIMHPLGIWWRCQTAWTPEVGDRVRGKTLQGKTIEGIVTAPGRTYARLDNQQNRTILLEGAQLLQREAIPDDLLSIVGKDWDEQASDLLQPYQFHSLTAWKTTGERAKHLANYKGWRIGLYKTTEVDLSKGDFAWYAMLSAIKEDIEGFEGTESDILEYCREAIDHVESELARLAEALAVEVEGPLTFGNDYDAAVRWAKQIIDRVQPAQPALVKTQPAQHTVSSQPIQTATLSAEFPLDGVEPLLTPKVLDSGNGSVDRATHARRVMTSNKTCEHYTPANILEAVYSCLGEVDLDPCCNTFGEPNVKAKNYFRKEDDGLTHEWRGKVFMNPPYSIPVVDEEGNVVLNVRDEPKMRSVIEDWVGKLVSEYQEGRVSEAIALVRGDTSTQWKKMLGDFPRCEYSGRVTFLIADEDGTLRENESPATFPVHLYYLGKNVEQFYRCFNALGEIWKRHIVPPVMTEQQPSKESTQKSGRRTTSRRNR